MSQIKSIAFAALLVSGAAGFAGHALAASAESAAPARAKVYAQTNGAGGELVRPAQDPAAKSQETNPWATGSDSWGVHIQSRAGFVGYR
jgi:hypothetical protein